MSVTFLHLADLHLGYRPAFMDDEAGERRRNDFAEAFRTAVDFSLDSGNGIDAVLIAGDVFDSAMPDDKDIFAFEAQSKRIAEAGKHVVVVPGNHDSLEYPRSVWKRTFDAVRVLKEPAVGNPLSLMISGTACHFYGFAFDGRPPETGYDNFKATGEDGIHVALLHGALAGEKQWADFGWKDGRLDPKRLSKTGMHYIALGHYHTFSEKNVGGVKMVYPGTLEARTFKETSPRYLVTATLDGETTEIKKIAYKSRPVRAIALDLTDGRIGDASELVDYLREMADSGLMLRVDMTGVAGKPMDVENVKDSVEDLFFYFDLIDVSTVIQSDFVTHLGKEKSIRGLFVQKLLERSENADDDEKKVIDLALKVAIEAFAVTDSA